MIAPAADRRDAADLIVRPRVSTDATRMRDACHEARARAAKLRYQIDKLRAEFERLAEQHRTQCANQLPDNRRHKRREP